ncbi:hypothetical protein [Paucibacter soli]|uniref:hypothetical protein n=1 Tax=Paucibacter soli TaxID=3133433 RepID=UPI0030A37482
METDKLIAAAPEAKVRAVLAGLLTAYTAPSFGVLPKAELELAMLLALQALGAIGPDPSIYELVATLRVTRAKARNLLYALELRRSTPALLDAKLKALLRTPMLHKQGELFALEVENPLLADHLKARLQQLGHASDGSFSASLVTLKLEAMVALVASCLSIDEQEQLRLALVKAGAPDTSLRGLLAAAFKKLGAKLASKAGEALMEQAADTLGPVLDGTIKPAVGRLMALLKA